MQDLLFHGHGDLRDYLTQIRFEIKKEIEEFDTNYLLNTSEENLVRYVLEKYSLNPPILMPDEKYIYSSNEIDIDVSQDPLRPIYDRSHPFYIRGISITIAIPFSGDGILFRFTPSTFTFNPPRGEIVDQKVHLVYQQIVHNVDELSKEINSRINNIKQYLEWVKKDIEIFNTELEPFIRDTIKKRKEKKMKDLDLVSRLGIPIKRREDAPMTYSIPDIKRKPKIERPVSTEEPFTPEPALDMTEYENILNIIRNMTLVIERSPSAFKTMREEDIRQHFLVQLNGQYEGSATGETFNYQGKTDILIRYEGRNVFIAECKFWKGAKSFLEAIDQLLSYSSWRDTKTAIIIFNRSKRFSDVLRKIPDITRSHPCFKREQRSLRETEFRFILHQPNDPNREIILTVLAFNVPTP